MPILELLEDNEPLLFNKHQPNQDFDQLSKEEQDALLDHIASKVSNDPKSFERLATMFLETTKKADFNTIKVQPRAGYVCKTNVLSSTNTNYKNVTIYINICYATAIPTPSNVSEKEIQKALNAEESSTFRVPLSMGQMRQEEKAIIMDACIHTQPYLRSEKDLDFRLYIIELAMEYVEEQLSVNLNREFTMPNIKSKGEIPSRILRLPKPSLITAVDNQLIPEWKLKPNITTDKGHDLIHIVIPMPLNQDTSCWAIDITANKITLTIDMKSMDILLPSDIVVDSKENNVKYYKKSHHLVIQLKTCAFRKNQYL